MTKSRALIVDPDAGFLKNLCLEPEANENPPLFATTRQSAQLLIADKTLRIAGIFINPKISKSEHGISVIRQAHFYRAGTPIYLIYDENNDDENDPGIPENLLTKLAISKILKKPVQYRQMLALVEPALPLFNSFQTLELAKRWSDPLNVDLLVNEMDFVSINASDYIAGHKTFFDIYVKLGDKKMIKILQSGDIFDSERIASYLKKGVFTMYIRKDLQQSYIAYCDQIVDALLVRKEIPALVKIRQSLNIGDQVLKFLYQRGINHQSGTAGTTQSASAAKTAQLDRAAKSVLQIQQSIEDFKLSDHPAISSFMSDLANYEHAVAVTLIVSMLMKPFGIDSKAIQSAIGFAAYFHDIGLGMHNNGKDNLKYLEGKKLSDMTREEMVIYYSHPQNGANILTNVLGLSRVPHASFIVSIVLQHHERRDGKGFPGTANAGEISQAAQLVGMADEFAKNIKLMENDPSIDPIFLMTQSADAYSASVMRAFAETFKITS